MVFNVSHLLHEWLEKTKLCRLNYMWIILISYDLLARFHDGFQHVWREEIEIGRVKDRRQCTEVKSTIVNAESVFELISDEFEYALFRKCSPCSPAAAIHVSHLCLLFYKYALIKFQVAFFSAIRMLRFPFYFSFKPITHFAYEFFGQTNRLWCLQFICVFLSAFLLLFTCWLEVFFSLLASS